MSENKIFRPVKNVMWRCGEQGVKISRQRTRNFTEHNFHMAENCAYLRTTETQHILLLKRKILDEGAAGPEKFRLDFTNLQCYSNPLRDMTLCAIKRPR